MPGFLTPAKKKLTTRLSLLVIREYELLSRIKGKKNISPQGEWIVQRDRGISSLENMLGKIQVEIKSLEGLIKTIIRNGRKATHDTKRPPGASLISTLPGHTSGIERYGITGQTLKHFTSAKKGVSLQLQQLPLVIDITPQYQDTTWKKRWKRRHFVEISMIVFAISKAAPEDVFIRAKGDTLLYMSLKLGQYLGYGKYQVVLLEVQKVLKWCAANHPLLDSREEAKQHLETFNRGIERVCLAQKVMHNCIRAGCKNADTPFVYETTHWGKQPEMVTCPEQKCRMNGARTYWCVKCHVPHHPVEKCDLKKKKDEHNERMRRAYPADGKIKLVPCPGALCGCLHIKDDACDHVSCNVEHDGVLCGTEFCFGCGRPFNGPGGIYRMQGSRHYLDHLIHTPSGWRCRDKH